MFDRAAGRDRRHVGIVAVDLVALDEFSAFPLAVSPRPVAAVGAAEVRLPIGDCAGDNVLLERRCNKVRLSGAKVARGCATGGGGL